MEPHIITVYPYADVDRDGDYEETGFGIKYANPDTFLQFQEVDITVDLDGKVKITNTVSNSIPRLSATLSKNNFLDLMSKLYDRAEVK